MTSGLLHAYAVLRGGGVKGAALAGAVAAAQNRGVIFDGFGGASAGAIVAALFALGYSGADIRSIFLGDAHPVNLVDDAGNPPLKIDHLSDLWEYGRRLRDLPSAWLILFDYWNVASLWRSIYSPGSLGLYTGDRFLKVIEDLLRKGPRWRKQLADCPLTFKALKEIQAPSLKIVASNLSQGQAKVFDFEATPDVPVSVAVRASMGYPFVFEPLKLDGEYLSDGGLASNLPVFLFRDEHAETGMPIIGFDITEPPRERSAGYDMRSFVSDLVTCSLEASDRLFQEMIPGVEIIDIRLDRRVSAMNLRIDNAALSNMFQSGQTSAWEFLDSYLPLTIATESHEEQVKYLQSQFAPPKIIDPILSAIRDDVEKRTKAKRVRVSLALALPRKGAQTWTSCYCSGIDCTRVRLYEFKTGEGLGMCVGANSHMLCTEARMKNIDPDAVCAIAIPVLPPDQAPDGYSPVRAVLIIDTITPTSETGWITNEAREQYGLDSNQKGSYRIPASDNPTGSDLFISEHMTSLCSTWSAVFYALRAYGR